MDKPQTEERRDNIRSLVWEFCHDKLNEEYATLADRLVQKLGRKRTHPLATGQPEVWAAGIIHALGTINFLFDQSFEPHTTIHELNAYFRTKKSTTAAKAKQIRDLLKLERFDNEFSTQQMRASNPFTKFVMVNGFIVPVDSLPLEYQEIVRQARAAGKDVSFRTAE